MNTTTLGIALIALSSLTTGTDAFAQENPNSAEFHARHNPNSPYYVDGAQQQAAPQQQPKTILDSWGAVAVDNRGGISYAYNYLDKEPAEQGALEQCKQQGGADCRVVTSYANGMLAISRSDDGEMYWASSGWGTFARMGAKSRAKNACKAEKGACEAVGVYSSYKACTERVDMCAGTAFDGKRH